MEFHTPLSTTRRQSITLLAMGLRPETADMHWHLVNPLNSLRPDGDWRLEQRPPVTLRDLTCDPDAEVQNPYLRNSDGSRMTYRDWHARVYGADLPAWSLGRLMEMMPDSGYAALAISSKKDLFDALIKMIQETIETADFPPEYLLTEEELAQQKAEAEAEAAAQQTAAEPEAAAQSEPPARKKPGRKPGRKPGSKRGSSYNVPSKTTAKARVARQNAAKEAAEGAKRARRKKEEKENPLPA